MESFLTKYEWLRKVDAVCDLFIGVGASGARSPAELDIPALLEQVPEYHASLVPRVYPELIGTILKPKNAPAIVSFATALKQYLADFSERMDGGQPLICSFVLMTSEIFFGMDLLPLPFECAPALLSAAFSDGIEEELDYAEQMGIVGSLCSAQKGPVGALELGRMPIPNIIVKPSVPCDPSSMIYQYMGEKYDVPVIVLDTPYYSDDRAVK